MHVITLATDFGAGSCYVAAMKGVLLGVNPDARLLDLTHRIPPQDLVYTSFFLQACLPFFPPNTLHVVVVDPGVGSQRAVLYVEVAGQRLLVPDNGCWSGLVTDELRPERVIRLTEPKYWRPQVSRTFHGRDIFAPAAGHLSLGIEPSDLGEETTQWVRLSLPRAKSLDEEVRGEVIFVDDFGNLLTNIPAADFYRWEQQQVEIIVDAHQVPQRVRAYSEADPGQLVALISSLNTLEIAINQGSAARQLRVEVGAPVRISLCK